MSKLSGENNKDQSGNAVIDTQSDAFYDFLEECGIDVEKDRLVLVLL